MVTRKNSQTTGINLQAFGQTKFCRKISDITFIQALLIISIFYIIAGILASTIGIVIGKKANKLATNKVLEILKQQKNNEINFTYKSDSKDINDTFGLSKKVFKKTLTTLIDSKKITLKSDSIALS